MWMLPPIRDLLDSIAAAAPDAGVGVIRTRDQLLDLLVALFRPAAAEPEATLREAVACSLDAALAERARRPRRIGAVRAA